MPDYSIDIHPYGRRVRVSHKGTELADSRRALQLGETGHEPVLYFPCEDVRMDLLVVSQHHSHCPFKGDASYWSVKLPGDSLENVVWAYEKPLPGVSQISGHMAFYQGRVEIVDIE